jgi:hypothetical protein
LSGAAPLAGDLGQFEAAADIGRVALKGSVDFDAQAGQYRITGSGENMWGTEDAFHFLWRRVSGNLRLSALISFVGTAGHEHRKAGVMIRRTLDPNSPYVDAVVHGNGLVCLQYRSEAGGATSEIQSPAGASAGVLVERDGDRFTLSAARSAGSFERIGAISLSLGDPVYVGLVVCSHDAARLETALFSQVDLKAASLSPGR